MAETPVESRKVESSGDTSEAAVSGAGGAVVAGLDGSQADGPVLDWAADEAERLGAQLRLVTVIDPGSQMSSYDVLVAGSPTFAEHLDEQAQRLLSAATTRVRGRHAALDIVATAPTGRAAATLVRLSEGALRLVVGGPARGRLERALLGSVALPVVAHAKCPVVVVPAGATITDPARIVVGVDASKGSQRAVEFALRSAAACGAAVTCVLVWNLEVEDGVVVTEPTGERWAAVERRHLAAAHRTVDPVRATYPDVDVTVTVRHGSTARELVNAASDLGAGLLVLGSRGRGGFGGLLLGSVSRRVVEQAGGVVAIVH